MIRVYERKQKIKYSRRICFKLKSYHIKYFLLFRMIKKIMHECSKNIKIYSPRKLKFPSGVVFGKYDFFFWGGGINLYISLTIMQLMYLEHAKYNTLSVMINFYWTHLSEPVSAFRLEHWPVHSSHWSALSLT